MLVFSSKAVFTENVLHLYLQQNYLFSLCQCFDISVTPYQWEGVGDLAIWGKFSSEAVRWKEFVTVVVLDNLPHSLQSHGICIHLVRTHVVQ